MRGSRVQTIVNELQGEKIDIIKWTDDLPTLISEAFSPAEIQEARQLQCELVKVFPAATLTPCE